MLCALTLTTPTRLKPRLFTCIPVLQMRNWNEAEGEPAQSTELGSGPRRHLVKLHLGPAVLNLVLGHL